MDYTSNKALAYNESLDYLLIEINDEGDFKIKKLYCRSFIRVVIKRL